MAWVICDTLGVSPECLCGRLGAPSSVTAILALTAGSGATGGGEHSGLGQFANDETESLFFNQTGFDV